MVAVVMPPPQLNVAPGVVEPAVRVTLVMVQVSSAGGAIVTFGTVMFWVTVVVVVAVQLLAGSVTITE